MGVLPDLAAKIPGSGALGGLSRFIRPPTNEHNVSRDATVIGIFLAVYGLSTFSLSLPLTGCLVMVALFAVLAIAARRYPRLIRLNPAIVSIVGATVSLYISLIQPTIGIIIGPLLVSIILLRLYRRRFPAKPDAKKVIHFARLALHLPVGLIGLVAVWFVYNWLYTRGIPAAHPVTVAAYNVSPFIYVICATLVNLYCVRRMGESKSVIYKVVPALSAVLFAGWYPMHDPAASYLGSLSSGDYAEFGFAAAVLILAFLRPALLRLFGSVVALAFCAVFLIFQTSNWAYMSAVGLSMPVSYSDSVEPTVDSRTMPYSVGEALCNQGDSTPKTKVGPVSIAISGPRFDYQCAEHYSSWIGTDPLLSLVPGSTLSILRVDAGSKSGEVREVKARFVWGEDSLYERAALMARHPGGTIADFNYTTAAGGDSEQLAVSFSQRRLAWGAMVPAPGGTVVESQSSGFEDYSVARTAREFPDFFQVPEAIVKLRAEAWAAYRNPMASAWSPDEVSQTDPGPVGNNAPPFALSLQSGPAYFAGLEPAGTNATAMSYLMFFDARFGTATIIDVSQSSPKLKGLRDLQHLAPSVVAGNNNLYGLEPIPMIEADGRCFMAVSIMGPHKEMRNKDFQGVGVFTCSGDKVSDGVVDTSAKVAALIKNVPSVIVGHPAPPIPVVATPAVSLAVAPVVPHVQAAGSSTLPATPASAPPVVTTVRPTPQALTVPEPTAAPPAVTVTVQALPAAPPSPPAATPPAATPPAATPPAAESTDDSFSARHVWNSLLDHLHWGKD